MEVVGPHPTGAAQRTDRKGGRLMTNRPPRPRARAAPRPAWSGGTQLNRHGNRAEPSRAGRCVLPLPYRQLLLCRHQAARRARAAGLGLVEGSHPLTASCFLSELISCSAFLISSKDLFTPSLRHVYNESMFSESALLFRVNIVSKNVIVAAKAHVETSRRWNFCIFFANLRHQF